MPVEARELRYLTSRDIAQVGQEILLGDIQALQSVITRAEHPDPAQRPTALQVWIASAALIGIKEGDCRTLNILLDRFVGKIPAILLMKDADQKATGDTAKTIVFEVVSGNKA